MDKSKLKYIITKGETSKIDFKRKLILDHESNKKEFVKDVSAIANTHGGRGYLVFGIEDKTREVVGIESGDFNEEKLQQIIASRVDPPVPIKVSFVEMEEKDVAVITILNSIHKPHQMRENGAFYIRRGTITDIMRKDEIASMINEYGSLPYETIPLRAATIEDLSQNLIMKYLEKFNIYHHVNYEILVGLGILHREPNHSTLIPTYGGVMLFSDYPQQFIPHCIIRINPSPNSPLFAPIVCQGNMLEMLYKASSEIEKYKFSNIPMDIVNHLLGNSLVHRDYFSGNDIIDVTIKDESIEITNPGYMSSSDNTCSYVKRNMWLYLKLLTLDDENKFFNNNKKEACKLYPNIKIRFYNIKSRNQFKAVIKYIPPK